MIKQYSLGLYEKAMPAGLSFPELAYTTASCGFDRMEISIDETDWRLERLSLSEKEIAEIGTIFRDAGVPIKTMCFSGQRKYPMGSHDPAVRARSMEIMEGAIRFAAVIGMPIIQLAGYDVYYEESDDETRKLFVENLAIATDMAARAGVILAFETMETPFMDTVEKSMAFVREIRSPYLGVYPDIGNLKNAAVLYGHDVVEDLATGRGHIFAMHLKETKPGVYRDMAFGSGGHTEYVRCIREALETGVRIFTGEFWHQDGEDHVAVIKAANAFLRERFAEAMSTSVPSP